MTRPPASLPRLLRPELGAFGLALLILVGSFGLELAIPWLVERAVDGPLSATGSDSASDDLAVYALLMLLCAVLGSGLGIWFVRTTSRAGQRIVLALRRELATAFTTSELAFLERRSLGRSLTNLTTDVENLDQAVTSGGLQAMFDLLRILGFLIAIAITAPELGGYLAVLLPTIGLLGVWFRNRARERYAAVRARVARQNGLLLESLRGISTLHRLGAEHRFLARTDAANRATETAWKRTVDSYASFFAATDIALRATQAGLLWVGGLSVLRGEGSPGELLRTWLYLQLLSKPLREFGERFHTLQAARSSLVRLLSVLTAPTAIGFDTCSVDPAQGDPLAPDLRRAAALEVHDVTFRYPNPPQEDGSLTDLAPSSPAIADLSLTIRPGEHIALVGPTGAGKSTLFRLLARLETPETGSIAIDGERLDSIPEPLLRRRVAVLTQRAPLSGETLREAIAADRPGISDRSILEALRIADPDHRLGIDLDRRSRDEHRTPILSDGERQIVALARSLVLEPGLLLLDEPSAALDPRTEVAFRNALSRTRGRTTVLVIAHRLETIRGCDRVLVLEQGRLLLSGAPSEFLSPGGALSDLDD